MARKSEWPASLWRISVLGLGLAPLVAMGFTDPWPWPNSSFITYLVVIGLVWLARTISIYKLVGPRAGQYRELALRRHGRGATFLLFIGTVFLITFTFATLYWALRAYSLRL